MLAWLVVHTLSVALMAVRSQVDAPSTVLVAGIRIVQVKELPACTTAGLATLATGTVQEIAPLDAERVAILTDRPKRPDQDARYYEGDFFLQPQT